MIRNRMVKSQPLKMDIKSEKPLVNEPIIMKSKEEQIELIRSQLTSSFSPTKENSSGFSQMSPNVPLARKNSQPEVSLNPVSGQKVYRDIVEPHEIPLNPTVQNISKVLFFSK